MRKRSIIAVVCLLLLFTVSVHAINATREGARAFVPSPKMTVVGSTASCSAKITAPGKLIDATLELKQGSTVVASWADSAAGTLILSGTATVTSGVTYTLTVSGTIDGVPFVPASITKTP